MNIYKRTRFDGTPLSPEQAARQGRIVRAAQLAFGGTEAVLAFLNTHHRELGGRPLDLATASNDGFERIESHMKSVAVRAA